MQGSRELSESLELPKGLFIEPGVGHIAWPEFPTVNNSFFLISVLFLCVFKKKKSSFTMVRESDFSLVSVCFCHVLYKGFC